MFFYTLFGAHWLTSTSAITSDTMTSTSQFNFISDPKRNENEKKKRSSPNELNDLCLAERRTIIAATASGCMQCRRRYTLLRDYRRSIRFYAYPSNFRFICRLMVVLHTHTDRHTPICFISFFTWLASTSIIECKYYSLLIKEEEQSLWWRLLLLWLWL